MPDDPSQQPPHASGSLPGTSSGLKGLTLALGIGPAEAGPDLLLGKDVGGVQITRVIADGGMGRVYEGRQAKPDRIVAVKVMRPGITSPSMARRFDHEAEVLGKLQHPGIAHIYSVGMHTLNDAKVPYFVMEYVHDAKSLTRYAEDLALSTKARLELFRSVCETVAYGHQKGVIHRDLKPTNILVDGNGRTKIIDFGIARTTDADLSLTTMRTDVGQLIGTLQYMSPEQFVSAADSIDGRSDIYALGVVLYELLVGKPPYDIKQKAVLEVMRIVTEDDPIPLSSLNGSISGDLSAIAGKCLVKERAGRYASASDLAEDISKYLAGEPIDAAIFYPGALNTVPEAFMSSLLRHTASQPHIWSIVDNALRCVTDLTPAVADQLLKCLKARGDWGRFSELNLERLATVTPEVAVLLSEYVGKLSLDGLTTLSPDVATLLAKQKGALSLNGLTTLSPDVAALLARHHGGLSLDGLTTLSPDVANLLTKYNGDLSLSGLTTLSPDVAALLAKHYGTLSLDGLTTLSPHAAHALSHNHDHSSEWKDTVVLDLEDHAPVDDELVDLGNGPQRAGLHLGRLTTISPEVAEALAHRHGTLRLWRLQTLSPEAAFNLAMHSGELVLASLTTLSLDLAQGLAEHIGPLALDGLTTLSPEVAAVLAKHKSHLKLNRLTTLTPEVAAVLATHDCTLSLDGLKTLSPGVAAVLAMHRGSLSLNGLTTLTPDVAWLLETLKHRVEVLGLNKLSPDLPALMSYHSPHVHRLLTTLSPDEAETATKHNGDIQSYILNTPSPGVTGVIPQNKNAFSPPWLDCFGIFERLQIVIGLALVVGLSQLLFVFGLFGLQMLANAAKGAYQLIR